MELVTKAQQELILEAIIHYFKKNRTHFEETLESVLVDGLTSETYKSDDPPSCTFVPGHTYLVVWNGKKYADVSCYESEQGNAIGDKSKYPFYINDAGGEGLFIDTTDDVFTVSIIDVETIVYKIDEKFLPDLVATKEYVNKIWENIANQIAEQFATKEYVTEFGENAANQIMKYLSNYYYGKEEMDGLFEAYITDIASLVGGDA